MFLWNFCTTLLLFFWQSDKSRACARDLNKKKLKTAAHKSSPLSTLTERRFISLGLVILRAFALVFVFQLTPRKTKNSASITVFVAIVRCFENNDLHLMLFFVCFSGNQIKPRATRAERAASLSAPLRLLAVPSPISLPSTMQTQV